MAPAARQRVIALILLASLCFGTVQLGSAAAQQPDTPQVNTQAAQPAERTLLVDASATAEQAALARSGATLLVDYGAFTLWRAPAASATRIAGRPGVTPRDDFHAIWLRGTALDTSQPEPSISAGLRQIRTKGPQFWMVQFVGPVLDAWLADLRSAGIEIVQYLPNNAYVVWGDAAALDHLAALAGSNPAIQWTGAFHPAYRLAPTLQRAMVERAAVAPVAVTVQLYNTADVGQSLARLQSLGGQLYRQPSQVLNFTDISLQLPAGQLSAVASWADVFNVEPYSAPKKLDEAQGQIIAGNLTTSGGKQVPNGPGYLAWLASKGFPTTPASYPLVDIVDDGLDQGNANNLLHPDFHELGQASNPDRVVYIDNCTGDATGNSVSGHGNLNAGIVGAYNNRTGSPHVDANGYRIGLGIVPYGPIAATKIFNNAGNYDASACGNTDQGVVAASFSSGATLTSDSWGADIQGAYDSSSQAYDALTRDASATTAGNQEMLHVFAAGNAGPDPSTVGSPGTAKNVLTVGATENVRDNGVNDGCNEPNADNADDMAGFSSRGPAADGRAKPDIVAPGTHIQGPASQDPGYDGTGVCGGNPYPQNKYYPSGQTLYTWSTGTSHSTPAVAGAAALVYEYYGRVLKPGHKPSPAMLKALLLNSPRYLTGVGANDTLPSPNQGWGGANLGTLFDGTPRVIDDQTHVLGSSGDQYQLVGQVVSAAQPVRVSLVWSDAPGSTVGNADVNDLDLEVTVGGMIYKGNVFNGANSVAGGTFDIHNNVENVFLPAGQSGPVGVRVIARNIAGDGLPHNADTTDQDFALVMSNASLGAQGGLQGKVTSAVGGAAIANAQVQVRLGANPVTTLTTNAAGNYGPIGLPAGAYSLSALAYGYTTSPGSNVTITAGVTTTKNIALTPAPRVTVRGTVTDGSGHGWPLYARIDISADGYSNTIFTDPATGQYSVTLASSISHTFAVSEMSGNYISQTLTFTTLASGTDMRNFALLANAACTAPGYGPGAVISSEDFEGAFPPAGWSVYETGDTTGGGWQQGTTGTVGSHGDPHGGTKYAWNNDDNINTDAINWMALPALSVPAGGGSLHFWQRDFYQAFYQYHGVWVTTGSSPDPTVSTYTELWTGDTGDNWAQQTIDLTAYAGQTIRLAFKYQGNNKDEWYIDDLQVTGPCTALAGGLVVGSVLDANTNSGINDAQVTDGASHTATSFATAEDPAEPDGFYSLFSTAGAHILRASARGGYADDVQNVSVTANAVTRRDFRLKAGRLGATPTSVALTMLPGQQASRTVTIANNGSVATGFTIFEVNAPAPATQQAGPFAPSKPTSVAKQENALSYQATVDLHPLDARTLDAGAATISWTTTLTRPWGIGFNTTANDLWIGNIPLNGGDGKDYRFTTAGAKTGDTIDTRPWGGDFAGDMTYDPFTNKLWQVNVGGDNCIYELDPATKTAAGAKICPSFAVSQRGLAFNPLSNTFYSGSWEDGLLNHFDAAGKLLDTTDLRIGISGLAFNAANGHLFAMTSHGQVGGLDVYVYDTNKNYSLIGGFNIQGMTTLGGAGLEIDCTGRLWAIDQNTKRAIAADSGETGICGWQDVPWLTVTPVSGSITNGGTRALTLNFNTTGLRAGTYRAHLRVGEGTPYDVAPIDITLTVLTSGRIYIPVVRR